MTENYLQENKELWNKRVPVHVDSDFYNLKDFIAGKNVLNNIELELLGDVKGKSILHLQCHFGQDSLCLARMGAQVTGIDFSEKAIEKAEDLNNQLGLNVEFICCDVYSLKEHLNKKFDIVFTSYGTIGWLPDMKRWAHIVSEFLLPGGKFIFAEFHPVVWMFDDSFNQIEYSYFNDEPIIIESEGTYTDRNADLKAKEYSWNHPIDEVLGALLEEGLNLQVFKEYNYSPYSCFKNLEEFDIGKFRFKHLGNKIPMVYALLMHKA